MLGHKPLNGINVSDSSRLALWWAVNWKRIHYSLNTRNFLRNEYKRNQYEFVDDFSFSGLEFGRYLNEGDRETRFAGLSEACKLLSSPIFFDSKNLGMDKHLLIAIGARGAGGSALAHFEASYGDESNMFINTTKYGGNHSFAHEYMHALDFFLGCHIDTSIKGVWLSDYNNGTPLRRVVAEIIEDCRKQMNLATFRGYWSRPKEILARSFETWVAWVLSQESNKEYENSFLCKQFSYYQGSPVYPHTFNEELDNKFILFCNLAGKALNGKSIETNMKKVANKTIAKTTKNTTKSTYVLKDFDKVNQMLDKKLGLEAVNILRVENGKALGDVEYLRQIGRINNVIGKCSSALVDKLLVFWQEKGKLKRQPRSEFVIKSDRVIKDIISLIKEQKKKRK